MADAKCAGCRWRAPRGGRRTCDVCLKKGQKRYRDLRAAGLCIRCGKDEAAGGPYCTSCRAKAKAYRTKRTKRARADGLCAECWTRPARPGVRACAKCAAASAAKRRALKYGISLAEYRAKKRKQGGRCAICGDRPPATGRTGSLRVDHDHKTRQLRDLLCNECNSGLGLFQESPARLRAAAAYVERWSSRPAQAA